MKIFFAIILLFNLFINSLSPKRSKERGTVVEVRNKSKVVLKETNPEVGKGIETLLNLQKNHVYDNPTAIRMQKKLANRDKKS